MVLDVRLTSSYRLALDTEIHHPIRSLALVVSRLRSRSSVPMFRLLNMVASADRCHDETVDPQTFARTDKYV